MFDLVVPDASLFNEVKCLIEAGHRIDCLRRAFNENGRWCGSLVAEAGKATFEFAKGLVVFNLGKLAVTKDTGLFETASFSRFGS